MGKLDNIVLNVLDQLPLTLFLPLTPLRSITTAGSPSLPLRVTVLPLLEVTDALPSLTSATLPALIDQLPQRQARGRLTRVARAPLPGDIIALSTSAPSTEDRDSATHLLKIGGAGHITSLLKISFQWRVTKERNIEESMWRAVPDPYACVVACGDQRVISTCGAPSGYVQDLGIVCQPPLRHSSLPSLHRPRCARN